MSQPKVLIVTPFHEVLLQSLIGLGYDCIIKEALPYKEAISEIGTVEGLVTSNHLPVDVALIDAGKKLKWIGRLGSGMEIIDTAYANQKGISCFSTPEGNANAVAEQALGMLIALESNLLKANLELRQGKWLRDENRGREIEGRTVGIVGLGNNGSLFAKKLKAIGLKVLAYDSNQNNYDLSGISGCQNLAPIYEQAEILSFHVPLNKDTYHYFNEEMVGKMQHSFVLLNLSRGPVVDQEAVYRGLKSGKISAAAMDVWEEEPFWKNGNSQFASHANELLKMPNFFGTPHIGGYSHEALYKMSKVLYEKIKGFVRK